MKPTDDNLRYSRQISLGAVGAAGQARLRTARALLLGAGGLGTPAAHYLSSAGLGHLQIIDFDTVDITNLPRQNLFRDADAGMPKAEVLALRLREISPSVSVTGISRRLDDAMLAAAVAAADVVLDCTDNFATRWQLNAACAAQGVPLVSGAAIRFEGQVAVFRFDRQPSPCYRCLYDEADENLLDCAGQGILAPVAGTVGCMLATEAIKVVLDLPSDLQGAVWLYDGLAGNSRRIAIPARPACPVCGAAAQAARGS
ncbi:MAG: molybdopterin-synthase adenylyltransferase MoeB [Gammaproteobacteria bacterium]|jgi:adenylyltransferase/sulfurtransferase|nr:molybdopterin-synthase adenylyltransferase MoeB [Gammaproteobacteria bacterium]